MLFSPPGSSKLIRSQGPSSPTGDRSIVDNLKSNGPPKFAEEVQKQIESPEEVSFGGGEEDGDDLLLKRSTCFAPLSEHPPPCFRED